MNHLLTLRPWQLFAIMWGPGILTIPIPLEYLAGPRFALLMLPFVVSMFGWFYALGIELPKKVSEPLRISSTSFKFHMAIILFVFIYISIIGLFKEEFERMQPSAAFIILPVLYYFVAVFIVFKFIAKNLAIVELNRAVKGEDYSGYMNLLWFNPIGIWFIQPKVNRIFVQANNAA